ncbi:MAG: XRE family transcriptional regulator [Phenylobacterium sp.]|uniref:helix-turn-helix domain-containing protein n=1 Tax=Phenylobacterium sp. TaxID=1871053 RepID=UPI00122740B1|nr:helix-turn-helix transcriptional regulator [Phenylobacterium sp.]TAL32812.1 MAG: XRE family transcriptional regulator [Phenylobacterium sp.]
MSRSSSRRPRERDEGLSCVLKSIRNHRRLTVQQVADRMALNKRTYERFEAGEGFLKVDRIFAFARATDSDPYANWASVKMGAPDFAIACIDSKLLLLCVAHARELFLQEGADLANLQAAPIVEALRVAFTMLSAELDRSRKAASRWLGDPGDPGDPKAED